MTDGTPNIGVENLQAILKAVLDFVGVDLKNRINLFVERALASLSERPGASFSARQQYRMAERWLTDNRAELETTLHQRIADTFTKPAVKKDVAIEELRLLDDESLKVVMMRAKLVSSVMDAAREQVITLEMRLDTLKQAGARLNSKAFTPGAIADGFMNTLEKLSVPPEVQILLMEAYSDRGAEMLTEIYRDLNELLIRHGVLPDLKPPSEAAVPGKRKKGKVRKAAGAAEAGEEDGGAGGEATGAGGAGGGPGGAATAAAKPGDTKAGTDFAPPWPAVSAGQAIPAQFAQLLDAKLSAMQAALAHLTGETWQPGTLRDTFKLPPPISLSPEQEESIDHIEAVFLDLIRDTRISARFRSELNRLVLPLMSLRLSDADLFKNPENPVRRFIRQLALLGFRDKEFPISEFEHISLIVGRIVSERGQEIASFSSGADALYTIARNEVRRQLEARQQSRKLPEKEEEEKGVAREHVIADSHRFVQSGLRSMSAGLHLPTVAQHFVLRLMAPWMMMEYQKHGEESDEVRDCVLFASNFFELLTPSATDEEHKWKIQSRQQALEQMALEGMRSGSPADEMVVLLEGMADYFEELNASAEAGLVRGGATEDGGFVSYLDDLPVTRATA